MQRFMISIMNRVIINYSIFSFTLSQVDEWEEKDVKLAFTMPYIDHAITN